MWKRWSFVIAAAEREKHFTGDRKILSRTGTVSATCEMVTRVDREFNEEVGLNTIRFA